MRLNGDFYRMESRMEGLPQGQSGFNVILNPDHLIYKAHFPGMPVTPGVCILQMIQELLSEQQGMPVFIKGIKNAKFIKMISPVTDAAVSVVFCSCSEEDDGIKAQGVVSGKDDINDVFLKFSVFLVKQPV